MRRGRKDEQHDVLASVLARLGALEEAVQENRRLNQRLADVVDVVTEVLVPAVDRDDERMQAALTRLTQVLDEDAPTDLSERYDGISS